MEVDAADVRADLEGRAVGRGVDHSPCRREELTHRPAAACTHSERWLRTLSEYLERHVLRLGPHEDSLKPSQTSGIGWRSPLSRIWFGRWTVELNR